jgi:hypothetical protein
MDDLVPSSGGAAAHYTSGAAVDYDRQPRQPDSAATDEASMKVCHSHNLNRSVDADKRYGVRVSLPPGDTFLALIDRNWELVHWYETERERDQALREMANEHLYSRRGDRPTLMFEPMERSD